MFFMSYLNSVTIVGFVGADPEQRQARNNGSNSPFFSVATQRSWKNAEDEWVSKVEWHRIAIFRPRLADSVLNTIKKGAHVLVGGRARQQHLRAPERQEQEVGDEPRSRLGGIRADVVRKLDRGEPSRGGRFCLGRFGSKLKNHPRKFITNFCVTSALRHCRRALCMFRLQSAAFAASIWTRDSARS